MSPSIYDHTNYRQYLKDWFEHRKGRPSVRGFARKVGCSPALLSSIMGSTRDLAPALVDTVSDALGHDEDEKRYFRLLVEWEQGSTVRARREALDRLMAVHRFKSARRIDDAMYLIFSRWYHPAVLELSRCTGFREDPRWIAATLVPSITVAEAADALAALEQVGFLARDADGRLRAADTTWATEHEVSRVAGDALVEQHRWAAERAADALDAFAPHERYFGTMALALTPAGLAEARAAVARFQEDMLARFGGVQDGERVLQLSVQFFPVSGSTRS